jgi:hypothetical protein
MGENGDQRGGSGRLAGQKSREKRHQGIASSPPTRAVLVKAAEQEKKSFGRRLQGL